MLPGAGEVVTLEPARDQDAPAIRALLQECGLPVEDLEGVSGFLVARNGRAVCGTIGLEHFGEAALLRSLAVIAERREKGLGRALCAQLLVDAKRRGVKTAYLLTTDAQAYFRGLGFVEADRATAPAPIQATSQFSALCPASATLMSREL